MSDDPEIPFRVSHATAIASTAASVTMLWKLAIAGIGVMSVLGAAILSAILMTGH